MFAYFGSKKKIAHLYPDPIYDVIIEPFCGSASYSLQGLRWRKQIKLYDLSSHVVAAWKFLIGATYKDIMALPLLKVGERLTNFNLSYEERCFLGFLISAAPATRMTQATVQKKWNERKRKRIANQVFKVKHWVVERKDFRFICYQNNATWFVDPPYQTSGVKYLWKLNGKGYYQLKDCIINKWKGQIIVCENVNANWLEFKPLKKVRTCNTYRSKGRLYTEGIYCRNNK